MRRIDSGVKGNPTLQGSSVRTLRAAVSFLLVQAHGPAYDPAPLCTLLVPRENSTGSLAPIVAVAVCSLVRRSRVKARSGRSSLPERRSEGSGQADEDRDWGE